MVDKHVLDVIEQLTLRKLEYPRQLLKSSDIPHSGVRSKVRERLIEAIEKNHVTVSDLQTLLEELDAWGDQRIRVGRLPTGILTNFQSLNSVSNAAARVGMGDLLDGEMALIAPLELTPVKIFYEEGAGQRRLRLLAAKTRQIMLPQPEIPDHIDQQYPDVIFRPFKVETQKALAFAEIDLVTGLTFISTTLLRQGQGYTAEFGEFIAAFQPLIALQEIDLVHFYEATHRIRQLPPTEVRLVAREARTSVGGKIYFRSHSSRADMRTDPELNQSQAALPSAPSSHCNCFWEPINGLEERVHTHIYGPEGEVSIFGQVREASVRYVLQRILSIN
jgi:hypothetical protein